MNIWDLSIHPFERLPLSPGLVAELRSDHAGEAGAVQIYRGMLAVSRDPCLRRFAAAHISTELHHLQFFEEWLPRPQRSRLLPVWKAAGWLLGAGSAVFGRRAAFRTVTAVETFVERHYRAQIEMMKDDADLADLVLILRSFCDDEVHHRIDASNRVHEPSGLLANAWSAVVGLGSAIGVQIARKV